VNIPVRSYRGVKAVKGPLLFLEKTVRVSLGEFVRVTDPDGRVVRGQVVDAGRSVTVVQMLDETFAIAPNRSDVTLTGEIPSIQVGKEMLGRVFTGGGAPLDDLPPPVGEATRLLWAPPLNPVQRVPPHDFIETGISSIDGLNTLVRGQKLPVFSGAGLPGLEIASTVVENARVGEEEEFAVIFAGIGITSFEADDFLQRFATGVAGERSVFFLNRAADPTIERILAPRIALTVAEYLAFDCGMHVLVVMHDMSHYCEALREIASAREEAPGRRGYPGYMYTDLASLFERAGVVRGCSGSITQMPILTMPDDDMTHPIPDLTGYITEGQIVLSRNLHRQGVFPPVDILASLSRLMNNGIGADKTVDDHRAWADQLYASYAQGREASLMAAVVGESGLSDADRRALEFSGELDKLFLNQGSKRRSITETVALGWRLLSALPNEDLRRIDRHRWEVWSKKNPIQPSTDEVA